MLNERLQIDPDSEELLELRQDRHSYVVYLSVWNWLVVILILQMVYKQLDPKADAALRWTIQKTVTIMHTALTLPDGIRDRIINAWAE